MQAKREILRVYYVSIYVNNSLTCHSWCKLGEPIYVGFRHFGKFKLSEIHVEDLLPFKQRRIVNHDVTIKSTWTQQCLSKCKPNIDGTKLLLFRPLAREMSSHQKWMAKTNLNWKKCYEEKKVFLDECNNTRLLFWLSTPNREAGIQIWQYYLYTAEIYIHMTTSFP